MNNGNRACLFMRAAEPDIECQRPWLTAFAQQKEMTVVCEIVEYGSACAAHRPCIDDFLQKAEAGEFDVVLAANLSRIARRTHDLTSIMSRLRDVGVEVWTADTGQFIPYEPLSVFEKLASLM